MHFRYKSMAKYFCNSYFFVALRITFKTINSMSPVYLILLAIVAVAVLAYLIVNVIPKKYIGSYLYCF